MPELPEVETIKNELQPYIVGHCVTGVTLFWDGIVRQPSVEEFCSHLIGQRITEIARRGKYLIFSLTSDEALIIHLKMTGSLLLKSALAEPDKFIRAIIHLDEEIGLHFRDPRKLGVMWLVEDTNSITGKLGPEPLEADFTPQILAQRLTKRTAPIKALLCDQGFIAGIGNMYADEALFAARIHPLRLGGSLSRDEIERLHSAIQQVLWSAIGNKGASVDTYFRPSGELGTAHFQFQVAHRLSGKLCPVCSTLIERIVVRNRGTYFCPKCQPG
ncbi:MAG TPA: bifunctional DNA-formamidopyrimidine glycosylase/DNA-(apurinic or apyrimidinic site) lyase [Dehalococcoidia bacterium]|jgi:formamidopyrimidine-DNA glycosylase|nr:bifunctional DNA-formamidopyrimidine glycosylase/DNA-(apurinic or apyrimidinic site) lyase [Dehalococcoidia bacterium]